MVCMYQQYQWHPCVSTNCILLLFITCGKFCLIHRLLRFPTARRFEKELHLWEYILESILHLLRRELSEYGRHLVQYFGFFVQYANIGDKEKANLLKVWIIT